MQQSFNKLRTLSTWKSNLRGRDNAKLLGKRDPDWWFTGKQPQHAPGFDGKVLRSIGLPNLDQQTKHSAMAFFDNGWTLYETLFASLQGEEAFFIPPAHGLRHPMQFYYGHTAALYVNKLLVAGLIPKTIDREFEAQFEVGVDEMRWDDDLSFAKQWPDVSEVKQYRKEVYNVVKQVVEKEFSSTALQQIDWNHPLWSFFMGGEHDRIHLETSAVLIRELPLRLVSKPDFFPDYFHASNNKHRPVPKDNELVPVAGRKVVLGKQRDFPTYGWDNEYGKREVMVRDFQCSEMLVSNAEFFHFVLAKGYLKQEYWTSEGWDWRRFRNTQHPQFWYNPGPQGLRQDFKLRQMFTLEEMDWSLPAVVNYHEAKAFCNWKSSTQGNNNNIVFRLLTEAEHQLILDDDQTCEGTPRPNEPEAVQLRGNLSLQYASETPVDMFPANSKGFYDATGNVWQWTEDKMSPLPGFEPHEYYLDFTEPCFDDKHHVIKGGSFISTCDNGASPHSRFHFRAHFHQMSGFRYCASEHKLQDGNKVYETQQLVDQYLDLHFSMPATNNALKFAGAFPKRCAELVMQHTPSTGRALDVGCAVGGSTFELTKQFASVVGVDFSQAFVDLASEMQQKGFLQVEEGGAKFQCPGTPSRASFIKGDACNLSVQALGEFDAVLAANLLCRLPSPDAFLSSLPSLVKPNGIVVLVSPFSWLEDFTAKEKWMGPVGSSEKELIQRMSELGFALQHEQDMPLLIKEHARKFQYIVSHAAVFRKI